MAKSGRNSGKYKQDNVTSQFKRDIYQEEKRTWLTIVEQSIIAGEKQKQRKKPEQIQFSHYVPNNPLNGSCSWSKQKWEEYKATK